ncbi:MAG TPA: Uma2 family endonuclease [Ktedonobacterales bacterium]
MAKPASATGRPLPGQYITYEQFLEWADEDTRAEWVDGEVVMNSPVSLRHEQIANFLIEVMSKYVRLHGLGEVVGGPFQMKLATSGREPDVLYAEKSHLDRLKSTYLQGPADLAVEIVSPESETRDRVEKLAEYQSAGVTEYWVLDPQTQQADFYQLDAHGNYQRIPPDAVGVYSSRALPGFWLSVDWLWQDPLPDTVATLLQIDPQAYAAYLRDQLRKAGQ